MEGKCEADNNALRPSFREGRRAKRIIDEMYYCAFYGGGGFLFKQIAHAQHGDPYRISQTEIAIPGVISIITSTAAINSRHTQLPSG